MFGSDPNHKTRGLLSHLQPLKSENPVSLIVSGPPPDVPLSKKHLKILIIGVPRVFWPKLLHKLQGNLWFGKTVKHICWVHLASWKFGMV